MKIAIIDYGMGNLKSVSKAFEKLGAQTMITDDYHILLEADGVVLPGVGAIKEAMERLQTKGLDQAIQTYIRKGKPFLGICLGMQLLFERSCENGSYRGLDILPGEIVKLDVNLKIPHVGWNRLEITKDSSLFMGVPEDCYVYFVHSYYLETEADIVTAYVEYEKRIAVAVQRDNVFGLQFHPEKSGEVGLQILENFVEEVGRGSTCNYIRPLT